MAAIRLANLVKRFGDTTVIPGLELEIVDEEFIVFLGPSGCGKSTLLRLIAGLERVDDGALHIGEELVNDLPAARRDIAMVFQDYALYPHMNVYQNMAFALQMQRFDKGEIERRIRKAAHTLDIEELLQRKPRALSGGQRQRVAMGRAMVREPKAFLFDEPLSNLDAKLRVSVRTEIKALAQALKTTMVFVTHDQVEAMTLADRIVVLEAGRIQQVGAPEQVYDAPANRFVAGFIGSPAMNFFAVDLTSEQPRLDEDGPVPIDAISQRSLRALGRDRVVVGVRPEHVVVDTAADPGLTVTVEVVEPLGSDTLCFFALGAQRYVARTDPERRIRPGASLRVRFRGDRLHVFEADEGGAALVHGLVADQHPQSGAVTDHADP